MNPYIKRPKLEPEIHYDCSADHPVAPGVPQDENIVECKVVIGSNGKKHHIDIVV